MFQKYAKPPKWNQSIGELGNEEDGVGFENVDFVVWMRTAALPNFRKPYRRLKRTDAGLFQNGLPAGEYKLVIDYSE